MNKYGKETNEFNFYLNLIFNNNICNTSRTVQIQPTLKYAIAIEICIFINSIRSLDMVCHLQHCSFLVSSSHIFCEQMISLQNEERNVYTCKCTLSHCQGKPVHNGPKSLKCIISHTLMRSYKAGVSDNCTI